MATNQLDPLADPVLTAGSDTTGSSSTPGYLAPTTSGAGALASAADPTKYTAGQLSGMAGSTKEATTYTPDENSLVSSQLTKLLSGDSAYVTRARTKAAEYAASRGLQNSSIGAGSGEAAAIDAALPIANADAGSYFTAQRDNAAATNAFASDSNNFARTGALAALNAGYTLAQQRQQQEFTAAESAATRQQNEAQFGADLALREKATDADIALKDAQQALAQRQTDIDEAVRTGQLTVQQGQLAMQQAQQEFQQTQAKAEMQANLQRTYLEARTALETSGNLDAAGKATAIEAMSKWYGSQVLAPIRATYGNPDAWPTAGSGSVTPAQANDTISSLYREVLGRDPDPSGIATYTEALANGMTADELRDILMNSDEYRNKP